MADDEIVGCSAIKRHVDAYATVAAAYTSRHVGDSVLCAPFTRHSLRSSRQHTV